MIKAVKLSAFGIFAIALISCSGFVPGSQHQVTPTLSPTSVSPTPKPSATATLTPLVTPTVPSITPTLAINPACIVSTMTTHSDGWDCINQSYGFSVHLPSTANISRVTPDGGVEIWLQNSSSDSSIERELAVHIGQSAEWCFPPEADKVKFGEHEFVVNNGYEPSGVVYAWKTYGIANEAKKVCIDFVYGFREWNQDDPLFPPEKDLDLKEVESILESFQWLEP
jgi:hypothetical protein